MPTPVGHSLIGLILYTARKGANWNLNWKDMLLFLLVANLADIDFLPGFFAGNPNKFHHGMTHSIAFAILSGTVLGLIYYFKERKDFLKYFSTFSIVYFSHLVLDYFGKDTKFPFGEQLFWPFSEIYVLSPVALFSDVSKASSSDIFIQSLFNWHNLGTVMLEAVIFLPILWLVKFLNDRKQPKEIKIKQTEPILTD